MEKIPTMLFVVAAALTNERDEILLQKRPENRAMAGLWEFPGGKVEKDETPESALIRELKEELDVDVDRSDLTPLSFVSEPLGDRHMLLILYTCRRWSGEPRGVESPEIRWVKFEDIQYLPMPPADGPLLPALRNYLSGDSFS